VEQHPEWPDAQYLLGKRNGKQGDLVGAISAFDRRF